MDYKEGRIARNTSYFTMALVIQKIISFGYFSYLAVKIGATGLGNYSFALFFTTILTVVIDLGIANVMVREVSKHQEKSQAYFSVAIAIKLPMAILTYALAAILIQFLDNDILVRQLVYIAGVIMILDSLTLTFYSFLRGHHNLKFESFGTVIFQLILLTAGILALNLTSDLRIIISALLLASLFNCIYSAILIKKKLKLKFFQPADKVLLKKLLILAVPFALAAIFTKVYGYIDTILVKQMIDETALGYYSLPYKIIFSLQFIPLAFVASLYPAFASFYATSPERLKATFEKSMIYLSLLAVPLTFGVIALARPLIERVYTLEYSPSVLPLQILAVGLFFLFLNFPLGSLLNACDRQKRNTVHIGLVMVFNIILNIILIPRFSYIGASIASVVSTFLMCILQFYVARQITPFSASFMLNRILKIFLAGGLMYLAIVYLLQFINFVVLVPIGAGIFLAIVYLMKVISQEDVSLLRKSFLRKSN